MAPNKIGPPFNALFSHIAPNYFLILYFAITFPQRMHIFEYQVIVTLEVFLNFALSMLYYYEKNREK